MIQWRACQYKSPERRLNIVLPGWRIAETTTALSSLNSHIIQRKYLIIESNTMLYCSYTQTWLKIDIIFTKKLDQTVSNIWHFHQLKLLHFGNKDALKCANWFWNMRLCHSSSNSIENINFEPIVICLRLKMFQLTRSKPYTLNRLQRFQRLKNVLSVISGQIMVIRVLIWPPGISRVQLNWTPNVQILFRTLSVHYKHL